MAAPSFMLRTMTVDGQPDQFLPDFVELNLSPIFSAPGTVTFSYPGNGKNADLLGDDVEISVWMNGTELGELRCIIESSEGNDADEAEDASVWKYTCRTMLGILDRAVVYPKNWPATNPPNHEFADGAGAILIDLLEKAQSRGAIPEIEWDFTDTHDSNGEPWQIQFIVTYDAGIKYTDVVADMVESGMLEVRVDGRTLQAYKPGTLGTDKSIGANPLRFQKARDMKESPRRSSTRDLATVLLVAGDDNAYVQSLSDGATMAQWGRREAYYSHNGTKNAAVLTYIGNYARDTMNRQKSEVTHGLVFETEVNPRPITNFNVGDWGLSDVGRGWEKYRIKQWVLSVANDGSISGSVTLNDLINERIENLNNRLNKLTNGTTSAGASEQKDDGKAPAVPEGITLSTDSYIDRNQPRATLTVVWNPVTENADGTELDDLDGYEVRWRYSGELLWRENQFTDSDEVSAFFAGIAIDDELDVQVRAFDRYNRSSGWSDTYNITTAQDLLAPAKPEPPVVTSNVGTLRVQWSGRDYQGQQQVADYLGVEVHVGLDGVFTPDSSTLKDFLTSRVATATTITEGLQYGTHYWVRLVAVDTSGNRSEASDETSTSHVILSQVVNTEIGTGEVGLNNTRFSDVGNLVDDGSFENESVRVERQIDMAGMHLFFDSSTSSYGIWSIRSDAWAATNSENLVLQGELPVKPGERIFGALDMRATSDATGIVNIGVRWKNKDNQYIDHNGVPTEGIYYNLGGMDQLTKDNTWYSRLNFTSYAAPPLAASMEIGLFTNNRSAGTVWVDAVEIRRQIDTLLVANAAITTAKIANLAVNNAKISDLEVGKLTAGTLEADIILGSRIRTADTGARVELNSSGIYAFNNSEVMTFNASAITGNVFVQGRVVSSSSGRRIELNPSSLPEIRFYPNTGSNYAFINAVSSGTDVNLGLNSGQFDYAGTTLTYRLYMTDEDGGARLETIISATQQRQGGFVAVTPGQAMIGHEAQADTNDSHAVYKGNGDLVVVGSWDYTVAPLANQGLVQGGLNFDNPLSGFVWNWGTTCDTQWWPNIQIRDQTAHAAGLETLNSTSFTTSYDVATTGTSGAHWWGWRS